MSEYEVAVVGAGFAGLRAARDLTAQGRSVVLLEARDRIGGRTHYAGFPGTDVRVELGGTWILPALQPELAAEIERYGLALTRTPEPTAFRWRLAGHDARGVSPVPLEELTELERVGYHLIAASHRVTFGEALEQQDVADLDVPLGQWLDGLGMAPATKAFLETFCATAVGAPASTLSTLMVVTWIAGFDHSPLAMFTGLSEKFADGTRSLATALLEDSGCQLRLSTPVSRVSQDDDHVALTCSGGEVVRAQTAVLAVPMNVWRDIAFEPELSPDKQKLAREGHPGRCAKVVMRASGAEVPFGLGDDTAIELLIPEFAVDDSQMVVGFSSVPERLPADLDAPGAQAALREFAEGVQVHDVLTHDWNEDPYARGAYTAYAAGQLSQLGAALRAPEGRVFFATSDNAIGWMGMIEGALERGAAAAEHTAGLLASRSD